MAWLAVDKDGDEVIFDTKPTRAPGYSWWSRTNEDDERIYLHYGSIQKLIGRKLTWEDEPVEI